uniref:Uncharacterized protein n=1 Tax=Ixodes ricinus TaxID=34613 RepID=V5GZX9_IXORI
MEICWCRLLCFCHSSPPCKLEEIQWVRTFAVKIVCLMSQLAVKMQVVHGTLTWKKKFADRIIGCNYSTNHFKNSTECESVCSPDKYCLVEKPQRTRGCVALIQKKLLNRIWITRKIFLCGILIKKLRKCVATNELSRNTFPSQRHCQASCARYSVCYAQESAWNQRWCNLESVWYFERIRKDCFYGKRCSNSANRF